MRDDGALGLRKQFVLDGLGAVAAWQAPECLPGFGEEPVRVLGE